MRRRWLLVGVVVAVIAVVKWPRGVQVTVTNRGPDSLSNVSVHVTGNVHPLGTLGVGESRTVAVRPTSESGVELEFTDRSGQRVRLNASCYLEPGYRGTIEIELEGGAIRRNENHIRLY